MANIVPGAIWRPIPIDYSRRPKRRKGRGLIGHIAVSNSADLRGIPDGNCWHFYLPYEGPAIQQIDLEYISGASRAGDATCASFESQGGLGTLAEVNRQRWNANQVWWAARILRHMHDTEGVPLEVMPDSRPESRGFGTHRLGVDPYRVVGGESWSAKFGKACPGDGRHAQRQEIVDFARSMDPEGGFLMALSDQQQQELYDRVKSIDAREDWFWVPDDDPGTPFDERQPNSKGEFGKRLRGAHLGVASLLTSAGKSDDAADVVAETLRQLGVETVAPQVVTRLDPADLQALAAAIADEQDRRARDGDPATGPTT